jgi:chromosome partitioning protein
MNDIPAAPRVLAIANQKGGVGKTTTAINLGTALAAIGERVLIVDLDPQGNASTGLGIDRKNRRVSTYDVMLGEASIREVAQQTAVPQLDVAPSTMDLLGVEMEIAGDKNRAFRLRDALRALFAEGDQPYSYILVDGPPSFNILTINSLAAAAAILVPLQCEFFALEGLSQLLQTVERVQQLFNADLGIIGVALTMFDRRNRLTDQVADDVRDCLGNLVFDSVIPRNVRLSEAPSHGLPALVYDHSCAGSRAYMALARELIGRLPERRKAA